MVKQKQKQKQEELSKDFTNNLNLDFYKNISEYDIECFLDNLKNKKGGTILPSTYQRKLISIKEFFNFLITKSDLEGSPCDNVAKIKKKGKKNPVYLTLDEAKLLKDSVSGSYRIRDYAIINLFLNLGIRLSELVNINMDDIKENSILIKGKGDKERELGLNDSLKKCINDYIQTRPKVVGESALFLSERRQRIRPLSVQNLVKKHIKNAGLDPEKYSVHKLRHTAATMMYNVGNVNIATLKSVLGHSDITTTMIYTHVGNKEVAGAIASNPMNY